MADPATLQRWLTEWFDENLTFETFQNVPDWKLAAMLVSDMQEAGLLPDAS